MLGPARAMLARLDGMLGGARDRRIVVSLAAVLALQSADFATVGASATQLEKSLGIGTTRVGLLLSVTAIVGAIASVPAGVLVDRYNRSRLLKRAVLLWAGAVAVSGVATGYHFLLGARVFLAVTNAVGGPAIASLTGDFFSHRERSRMYGYILAGEIIGAGFGFVVAGEFATVSWRASFLALVPAALGVAWLLRGLEEPRRTERQAPEATADFNRMPLWSAVRYVVSIPSNVILIMASALAYFFFSGLRGFGIQFVKHHYGLSQTGAVAFMVVLGGGLVLGSIAGGRITDRLLRRGWVNARLDVAGITVLVAAGLFLPAIVTTNIAVAFSLFLAAAVVLGATNPAVDAARLDVMPPQLWGRAEAVRGLLKSGAEGAAPLVFGYSAEHVFGPPSGVEATFLVSLLPLATAAVLVLVVGRRVYPRDVAKASNQESTTTDRSTSPRCILSNAASTSVTPIVSDTNFSSGNRP